MIVKVEGLPSEQIAAFATILKERITARKETPDTLKPERTDIGGGFFWKWLFKKRETTNNTSATQNHHNSDTEALSFIDSKRLRRLRVTELDNQTFRVEAFLKSTISFEDKIDIHLGPPPDYSPLQRTQDLVNSAALKGNTQLGSDVGALRSIAVFLLQAQPAPQPVLA